MKPTTVEEFEQRYAEASSVSISFLHDHGIYGAECCCEYYDCQGFQMAHFDPGEHEAWLAADCPDLLSWRFIWMEMNR